MAGPWEKYQSASAATSPSEGPWAKYQQPQTEQSPPQTGGDVVSDAEQRFGIPAGLLSAVISKESSGNSKAISPKGAIGLGQVMPGTARGMGYDPEELKRNPALQVEAAGRYLKQMLDAHGNVTDALAAYNWGPGNVQKFMRGEKTQIPAETVNYVTDPRFAQWTQPAAQPGGEGELAQLSQQAAQPWAQAAPEPTFAENLEQAGRGLAQSAVNAANIPGQVVNTALGAAGVPAEDQVMQLRLPESMRPTDPYAQLGAEIGPYLIPGLGAERTAAALASTAGAGRAERVATQAANMLAENLPGAIAQSTQNNDLSGNLATGLAGSVIGRGLLAAGGRAAGAIRNAAQREGQAVPTEVTAQGAQAAPMAAIVPPEQANPLEASVRNLANKRRPDLASSLDSVNPQPDVDILQSASRLGVDDKLLPSHFSGNQQYRAVEQALKSRKGSALRVQEDDAINALAKRTGELIDDAAGTTDALAAGSKFYSEMQGRMGALERRSDQLYARVDNAMPPGKPVAADNTALHLEKEADSLGGWENLDTIEQRVFKAINPGDNGTLTYANLNKQRRLVGQALYKKSGPYKDADEAALSRLYANLSEDQKVALGELGARRDFEVAQRLVQMRKTLEEQDLALRGGNLTGDVGHRATRALQSMSKGDGKAFRELMNNVPSRNMKYEIIATGMRDMLSAGKRGADFNPGGFADWWQNMKASGQLRLLAQHAPRELMTGLADVYNVARGIQRAKRDEITTGALNEFVNRFNRVTQGHELAAKYAQRVGVVAGAKGGALGSLIGDSIGAKIAEKARLSGGAGSADAAEKLIASSEYQQAFKSTKPKRGSASAEIDSAVRRSSAWGDFLASLPEADRKIIARIGILGWLSAQRDKRKY
ncbi:lytic transglycosylase domain-containing protein [Serratia marcescens]|uniref:lytic transglycosylase domain-containing protein n=1 Tax=Serratia sarumanii TaxID=3020826 RepID=UPI002AD1317E|nr:lytic transglycosylase domain-containing protein [Serratia marcescens]EMC1043098.1 lytic transglycosylase domain-containing protein [Serratia marcescens]HBV0687886.1 lytic transglycosylase domain-containing protein [Serratia marcescens]